jgi:hypothetical protein
MQAASAKARTEGKIYLQFFEVHKGLCTPAMVNRKVPNDG